MHNVYIYGCIVYELVVCNTAHFHHDTLNCDGGMIAIAHIKTRLWDSSNDFSFCREYLLII